MEHDNRCSVHDEYIKSVGELSKSVATLNSNVDWLIRIGKWAAGTILTLCLLLLSTMVTFSYKASDVYATVKSQEACIAAMQHDIKIHREYQHIKEVKPK